MVCVTCCVFPGIWTDGLKKHSEAIESCKGRGGLAKSELFRRVPGTWSMPSLDNRDFISYDKLSDGILLNGESAWVAGYAQFREKFYTLEECQDANKQLNKYRETNVTYENNIFECVDLHGSNMRNFQCGMIEYNGVDWIQSSAKCLDSLSVMCTKRKTEKTDTWSDAIKFCGNTSDEMYPYLTEAMKAKANQSNKYWLSTFRSFRVHDQYSQNTDACLSVTRTGNYLALQPDDCGRSQKYICANDIEEGYNNKTDDTGSKEGDNNTNSKGMIALVVVVSLIIAVVICLRRRKATNGARKPIVSESSTATNVIKGTCAIINTTGHRVSSGNNIMEEHEYDTPGDGTDAHTVSSTKPNNSKIRSDKPDRDTSRQNQKLQKNYENFKHVSTENRKVDSDVDFEGEVVAKTDKHEYVALNQNMAPQSTEHEYAEMHVYNNTPVQNDDNEGYD
ncbi:hypothetical protein MAR_035605 [Mya arenaria]|uniref:C-type lectin domain-containing protein n=1 Tax=Mya arenaria TaxID=6604 RepID=A0ABY7EN58_MYAAR|nr:hypothetical protein MAR_035605 [Mya arenaria]